MPTEIWAIIINVLWCVWYNKTVFTDRPYKITKQVGTKGSGNIEFSSPFDLEIDEDGKIYISDNQNSRIQVFDHDMNFLTSFKTENNPLGIVLQKGLLYICGEYPRIIFVHEKDGKLVKNSPKTPEHAFCAISQYPNNTIAVVAHRFMIYDDNVPGEEHGKFIPGTIQNSAAYVNGVGVNLRLNQAIITLDASVTVYDIATGEKLHIYTCTREDYPIGVSVDSNDNLIVAMFSKKTVVILDKHAKFIAEYSCGALKPVSAKVNLSGNIVAVGHSHDTFHGFVVLSPQ